MRRFRMLSILTGVVVVAAWIFWVQYTRPQQSMASCKINMKALGLALATYHDDYHSFPSAYSDHSWRIGILPALGESALFAEYDSTAEWDSPGNCRLLTRRPEAFGCPSSSSPESTPYQAIVGVQTAWPFSNSTRKRDFYDGMSNTIHVIENHDPEVLWTSQNDTRWSDLVNGPMLGPHSRGENGTTQVLMADGSVRTVITAIDLEIWRALLSPQGGSPIQGMNWTNFDSGQLSELLGTGSEFKRAVASSTFAATRMLPFADEALNPGENMIYCPTFALAWQRYCKQVPQAALTEMASRMVDVRFGSADINDDDLHIFAGRAVTEEVEIFRKTGGFGEDDLHIADSAGLPIAYCALKKELPFIAEFEPFENPLMFDSGSGSIAVRSFGVTSKWDEWGKALGQVQVLEYLSPDEFVIRIGNLAGEDLILAKVPRPETLMDGMTQLKATTQNSKIEGDARAVVSGEQLVIPVLEMSLLEDFTSQLNDSAQPLGQRVMSARQKIQFRLNESGARLLSEAAIIGENGHYEYKVGERTFIFDKPFLVVLRESDEKEPYFAAWIANNDLMLPPR